MHLDKMCDKYNLGGCMKLFYIDVDWITKSGLSIAENVFSFYHNTLNDIVTRWHQTAIIISGSEELSLIAKNALCDKNKINLPSMVGKIGFLYPKEKSNITNLILTTVTSTEQLERVVFIGNDSIITATPTSHNLPDIDVLRVTEPFMLGNQRVVTELYQEIQRIATKAPPSSPQTPCCTPF